MQGAVTVTVWVTVVGFEPVQMTSTRCVYTLAEASANKAENEETLENFIVSEMVCEENRRDESK